MESTNLRLQDFYAAEKFLRGLGFTALDDDMQPLSIHLINKSIPQEGSAQRERIGELFHDYLAKSQRISSDCKPHNAEEFRTARTTILKRSNCPELGANAPKGVAEEVLRTKPRVPAATDNPFDMNQNPPAHPAIVRAANKPVTSGGGLLNFSCACTAPQGPKVGQTFKKRVQQ